MYWFLQAHQTAPSQALERRDVEEVVDETAGGGCKTDRQRDREREKERERELKEGGGGDLVGIMLALSFILNCNVCRCVSLCG